MTHQVAVGWWPAWPPQPQDTCLPDAGKVTGDIFHDNVVLSNPVAGLFNALEIYSIEHNFQIPTFMELVCRKIS